MPAPADPEQLSSELAAALGNSEIWPAFQPQVHLPSGAVAGFEVLARWSSPVHGEVPPAIFIPLAQRAGIVHELSLSLIRSACTRAQAWPGTFYLACNIAPEQFLNPHLARDLEAVVASTGFPFDRLQIEITEDALFLDQELARRCIHQLKAAGARLSLDDFGTGHSSLTRLQAFPFDEIKIDLSFVRDLDSNSQSLKIVTAVLGLGQSLGLHVVAEGIETAAQRSALERLGCVYGQGFLLGRPVPAEHVPAALAQRGLESPREAPIDVSPFQRLHQLETLYRGAPVALCFLDPELRIVSANAKFSAYFGFPDQVRPGTRLSALMTGEGLALLLEALTQGRSGAASEPFEFQNRDTGNTLLIAQHRVCDAAGGLVGLSLVMIDITSRVMAERAIRESVEHFQRSTALGPHISWAANPDGEVDYISPSLDWPILGTALEHFAYWTSRMDIADRLRVRAEWQAHLHSREVFQTEFRILWSDDTLHLVRSRAHPHLDAAGRVVRWYGFITDITRERELESRIALLESADPPQRTSEI